MKVLLRAIYPYIYLCLFLTIPFDNYVRVFPNILMAALVLIFPFVVDRSDWKKMHRGPVVAFLVFILYIGLNAFFQGRFEEDFVIFKKIALAFGLAILYLPVQDRRKISMAIIFSSLAAIVFSIVKIIIIINVSEVIALGYSREVIEALLIDRLYLGLLSVLSILISYQSISRKYHPNNQYHLINIIINVLFTFLMVSKVAIIVLAILFLLRLLYSSKIIVRISAAVIAIFCVVILFTAIRNLERTESPLAGRSNAEQTFLMNTLTWELRTTVWRCGVSVSKKEGFIVEGLGFEGTRDSLLECYANKIEDDWKRNRFVSMGYNSHNQFIDLYLMYGIVALVLFVVFLLVTLVRNRKHYFTIALLVTLISYALVENVFHRQIGAYYVGFILIVLLSRNFQGQMNELKED